MSEKAVSSVLGYTLILGIVIMVLSLVFAHTYTMVDQAKEKVKYESMAQGFEKIQNMINYVAYSGTSKRYVRILLNGGTMTVGKGCYLNVSVYNSTGKKPVYTFSGYTGSIDYSYGNYRIAFENGGVWLSSHGFPTIVSQPRIFIYKRVINNQTVFFMAITNLKGKGSVGGNSFAGVFVSFNSSKVKVFGPGYARINVTSEFAKAWYSYFKKLNSTAIQVVENGSTVTANVHFSEMILTEYNLSVEVR